MNSFNTTNELEKQFSNVKKKLEHFQYNLPLGLDSVQLADKLLADLLKTTKGFQEMKSERDRLKEQLEGEKQVPLPLRNENAKLLKENNDLHRELIKLKEDMDFKSLSLNQSIKKLETEKEEIRFLLTQKDIHIRSIENESESLRRKMNELLNKMYGTSDMIHSTTYTGPKLGLPNAEKILKTRTMNIIGRKNEMAMTKGLDPNKEYDQLMQGSSKLILGDSGVNKEEWAKDLHLADERADNFRNQIRQLNEEKNEMSNKMEFLERQISNRDLEIRRLQSTFLNTDNIEELKVRYQTDMMKMTVEKLNSQIDFLNKENQKLNDVNNFHNTRCKEDEIRKLDKEISQLRKDKDNLNRKLEAFVKNINSNTNENLKKNVNLKIDSEKQNNPYDTNANNILKEKNVTLLQELEKAKSLLTKSSEDNKLLISDFNSERLALLKSLDNIKSELIQSKSDLKDLTEGYDSIEKKNEQLLAELNLTKGKELVLNKDFESKAENVSKIYQEYQALSQENKSLRKKVSDLEEKSITLLKDNKELTLELENLNVRKGNVDRLTFNQAEETKRIQTQYDNLVKSLNNNESQMKVLEAKKKNLEEENKNLNTILGNKNSLIGELEVKSENYFRQLQEANDNYSLLQAEHRNLSNDFTEMLNSNKKLEEKIRSFERDYNESKFVKEKLAEFEGKDLSLKSEMRILERENRALKSELKNLNDIISENKSEINSCKESNKVLQAEKEKLLDQLEKDSNALLNFEENTQHLSSLNSLMEEYKNKNIELNNKLNALKSESEKLKSDKSLAEFELKKKNIEINKLNENISRKENEYSALREENKSLTNENEKIKEEVLMKRFNENNNLEITESLMEMKDNLEKEKSQKEKVAYESKSLNEKMQKLVNEKSQCENKLIQLTNLLSEADKTRGELLNKLQGEMVIGKNKENELTLLHERERNLDIELNKLREENNHLKQGIASIDQNFDNLNNELDSKTEDNSKLNLLVNNLKEQNEELTKRLSMQFNKTNVDTKRLSEREAELTEIKNFASLFQNENADLKSLLSERNKEIQDLNYDMRCLQSENQSLVEDLTALSKENEKLNLVKSQLEKNSEVITQKFRSNELDLNEIYSSYKDTCKENERLKQNLKIFIDENKLAAGYIKQVEAQLSNYQNNASNAVLDKDNLMKKIDFLEKYNTELTNEIARLKQLLNLKGSNEDFLKENVKIDKEINMNYENHIANLNRQIANLESEKQNLVSSLNNFNNKMEFLSHGKTKTEESLKKYEDIINEERRKFHNLNINNQKLKDEINYLKDENKRIVKMINENRDIKELKNQILGNALIDSNLNLNLQEKMPAHNTSVNTGRTPNFLASDTFSSGDENDVLKRLVADLNNQIEDLRKDLNTVRQENTRLMSERSMRDNFLSDRNMSNSKSESVSSNNYNSDP